MTQTNTVYDKHVLCIDDDLDMLEGVARILRPMIRKVSLAPSGEAGIALAVQYKPDLILLDIGLPRMDGWQVLQALKEKGFRSVPIVMLTGRDDAVDIFQGYHEGCIYYITKPFQKKHIVNIIDYVLGDLSEEERNKIELEL